MTALVASARLRADGGGPWCGGEVPKLLASVVIGGLLSATLLTLFVLPAFYPRFSG